MHERTLWVIAGACLLVGLPLMLVSAEFLDDAHTQLVTVSGKVGGGSKKFFGFITNKPLSFFF